jgi:hypothetical protein
MLAPPEFKSLWLLILDNELFLLQKHGLKKSAYLNNPTLYRAPSTNYYPNLL